MLDVSILLTREETPGATFEAGLTFFSTPFPSLQREHENNLIRYSRARDARLPLTRDRVDETRWVAERRERDCNCACTRKRSFITRSFFSSMARGLAVDSGTRLECDFQLNWMISDLDFSFLLVPFFFFFSARKFESRENSSNGFLAVENLFSCLEIKRDFYVIFVQQCCATIIFNRTKYLK